jgi:hypothetical protein
MLTAILQEWMYEKTIECHNRTISLVNHQILKTITNLVKGADAKWLIAIPFRKRSNTNSIKVLSYKKIHPERKQVLKCLKQVPKCIKTLYNISRVTVPKSFRL